MRATEIDRKPTFHAKGRTRRLQQHFARHLLDIRMRRGELYSLLARNSEFHHENAKHERANKSANTFIDGLYPTCVNSPGFRVFAFRAFVVK
jgi:hypothetical protein